MGSDRAPKPAPLNIAGHTSSDASSRHNSFGSDSTERDREIPRSFSDAWATYNQAKETSPSSSQQRSTSFKSPKATSPTANVYTHCGRHSNQWLFGDMNLFRRNKKD